MDLPASDPKAGEKTYYARLNATGRRHAEGKPFSDPACGKYLADLGALLLVMPPPPARVLDLGCGTGWTSRFLARCGYGVVGIDISPDAIAAAQSLAAAEGLTQVEFFTRDYEELAMAATFDFVLFYDALHHAEDEQAAVTAAWRALKPGGVLFAFEPGRGHSGSAGARHAVASYGVHEKDMPPVKVWRLGRRAGFRRALFLPTPHDAARTIYRHDYLKTPHWLRLQMERAWGYFRLAGKLAGIGRSGFVILWK